MASESQKPKHPVRTLRGRVNDRILRKRDYTHVSVHGSAQVDCAYLVTTGDSPHVPTQIARLGRCAHKVVVLCTTNSSHGKDGVPQEVEFVPFQGGLQDSFLQSPSSINPTLRWNRQFDIPTKRTFAIQHAIAHGFKAILLVDDDILFRDSFVPSAIHLLQNGTDIACSYCLRDADVSTLDRVRCRLTGECPEVSISGNAVVLKVGPKLALFPYVYNEDWLFLWASMQYGGARLTPFQDVIQRPRREGRDSLVRMEQFGEVIVFALFYQNGMTGLSLLRDRQFVRDCLDTYRARIVELQSYGNYTTTIAAALNAVDEITPRDVCAFAENLLRELEDHYECGIPA